MTILIVGSLGPGSLEKIYFSEFQSLGFKVLGFDIVKKTKEANSSIISRYIYQLNIRLQRPFSGSYTTVNEELIEFVKTSRPDYVFVFKGLQIFPETIMALKAFIKKIFCFNPDHPFKFYTPGSGNKYILDSIPLYDFHLTYSIRVKEQLISKYNVPSYYLPFGFVNYNVTSLEITDPNIIFVGFYDKNRGDILTRLKIDNLKIYGPTRWIERKQRLNKYLNKVYQGKPIFGDAYGRLISSSVGSINLLREQNMAEESHNMRTFEVPGNGGLLFTNRTIEQMDFFVEDKEIVFFDSEEELRDKALYYSKNIKAAACIKNNALKRSFESKYDYKSRTLSIIDILKSE
jgi:spore maturation protein CgeB